MKVLVEELASSLDEIWSEVADLRADVIALYNLVKNRDSLNLVLAKDVERLVREKEIMLMHLGLQHLEERVNEKARHGEFTAALQAKRD